MYNPQMMSYIVDGDMIIFQENRCSREQVHHLERRDRQRGVASNHIVLDEGE